MAEEPLPASPYVGPRPFEEADSDRFFGRDKEIRQLASLVVARRVVVLYARSGAGKTSLLKAGLIPFLRQRKRLHVLPVQRVRELVGGTWTKDLENYLASQPPPENGRPCLLVVDQLEEIFSTHRLPHEKRAELFSKLRQLLDQHPRMSLLLSLREDDVAGLDPHAALLPDRLRARFRLELLDQEAALQAIQLPALQADGELSAAAAQALVDDLRTVRIQRPDGSGQEVLSPWVEPVHLQVVCHRLWSQAATDPGGARRIEVSDLTAVDPVDNALGAYYDAQVAAVAAATGSAERVLRDWIENHLITEHGIRGQVLQGVDRTHELANPVVRALVDARLVRAEKRRGATWFELAHDRLAKPVQASNAAWRQAHLRSAQRQAALWAREGRPADLLLGGDKLDDELAWAETRAGELTEDEQEFLAASRQVRDAEAHSRRARQLRWVASAVALVLAATLWQLQRERGSRRREQARGLASQALSQIDERLDLALLLSLEANRIDVDAPEVRGSLLTGLQYQPRLLSFLHGHEDTVWAVAFRPQRHAEDKTVLASGGFDHRIVLWDVESRQPLGPPLEGHTDGVLSLAFSRDGRLVSTATGKDRRMLLWDLTAEPPTSRVLSTDRVITSAVFDPHDEDRLLTGDTAHEVRIWDLSRDPPQATVVGRHDGWVTSVAFDPRDPGPGLMVSGGTDGVLRVWSGGEPRELSGHADWVSGLAWSPDGEILVSAGLDRTVRRWNIESRRERPAAPGEPFAELRDRMSDVAVSPDGKVLAASTANGVIHLWDMSSGRSLGPWLAGNLALTRSLAFSPDGRTLAAANGSAVVLWDLTDLREQGSDSRSLLGLGRPLAGGRGEARSLAFSPDGTRLAVSVGGSEGEIRWLDASTGETTGEPVAGPTSPARAVVFDPDGKQLATFGDDGEHVELRLLNLAGSESKLVERDRIPDGIGRDREALSRTGDHARILEKAWQPQRTEECTVVRTLIRTADGKILAVDGLNRSVRFRDLNAAGWRKAARQTHCVRAVAISFDGELLAAGGDEGTIELWRTSDLKESVRLWEGILAVRSLAFSPDGQLLASGGDDGIVRLWDPRTSSPGRALVGHVDSVQALAFDPRGRILASAGRDRTVILWDVATGIPLGRPLRGHGGPIRTLAFSPDGERLASGGEDGVWLWELGFEAWRERACRIANRNLTDEEWELFVGPGVRRREPACP